MSKSCLRHATLSEPQRVERLPYSPSLLLSETLRERDAFSPSAATASQTRTGILRQVLPLALAIVGAAEG